MVAVVDTNSDPTNVDKLVKLAIGQDAPVGSEVKVRFQTYEFARKIGTIQDVVDIPFDPSGSILVTAREVI